MEVLGRWHDVEMVVVLKIMLICQDGKSPS